MRKLKLFTLFAAMMFATSMWATDPMGAIDGLQGKNGSFRVWGWAIDPDDGNYKVTIHVYVYTSATETNAIKSFNAGAANISRPDLESMGYGTMHGYDFNLSLTDLNPGTYYIRVFALNNVSSQNNPALAYSSDVYVKAVTVSASYTVSYDANGGTGAPGSQKKAQDVTLKLSTTTPTRTGYTFNGWNTNNSGTGTNYAAGANYTANANVTLYAQWNANKYTVTLDLQGAQTGSTSVEATYDAAMPAMTVPTRKGFTFAGYYDAVTSGTKYYNADGTSAKNWDKASNTTLYARWTIDPMTDVVYLGKLNDTIDQESVAFNRPEAPEVAGFTFVRWDVVEGPLSEGIKLQAVYAENEPSGAPKKQVGKFTLTRKGDKNEYILK